VLRRVTSAGPGSSRRVVLAKRGDRDRADEEWFVWHRQLDALGQPDQRVEIAFRVSSETGEPRLLKSAASPLVVFFPTQKETFLGFVIQGPYRTTPARDNVPEHDPWNQDLVRETATLLATTTSVFHRRAPRAAATPVEEDEARPHKNERAPIVPALNKPLPQECTSGRISTFPSRTAACSNWADGRS